jgi:hypothetical protein
MSEEVPQIMLIMAVRYCYAERWGDAVILLEKVSFEVNNKKAIKLINNIDPVVYYGGNIIPFLPDGPVNICHDGTSETMSRDELVAKFISAKGIIADVLMQLMKEVAIDMPSFLEGIKGK